MNAKSGPREVSIHAVVTRLDGSKQDLGKISYWHRSFWLRLWWYLFCQLRGR
jgi:uncharacterized membrane protein